MRALLAGARKPGLSVLLVVIALVVLAGALVVPAASDAARARRGLSARRVRRRSRSREGLILADPGRERRAEARARELLRSCVNEEEWAMYRDLGFIRLVGRPSARPGQEPRRSSTAEGLPEGDTDSNGGPEQAAPLREDGARVERRAAPEPSATGRGGAGAPAYAYLLYPHKPVLAYEPGTHRLLSEYCVEFPDLSDAVTGARLPGSDDVLAKWMALTGDEARLLRDANMHLPGRQLDPGRVRRDLWRLGEWERRRRSADASSR